MVKSLNFFLSHLSWWNSPQSWLVSCSRYIPSNSNQVVIADGKMQLCLHQAVQFVARYFTWWVWGVWVTCTLRSQAVF